MKTLSNLGHTIQKMIHNTPIAITANDTTTSVVTSGGSIYQAGLISGKIQYSFKEAVTNENIVGHVIDTKAIDSKLFLLNDTGSVFEYYYNAGECSPVIREIYTPAACGGDKAVKIATGRAHVVILTQNNKIWGAGDNSQYQLVPQGQCKYDSAVELIVTDTNVHDNDCCSKFTGNFNQLECPKIPQCDKKCNKVSCIKDDRRSVPLGSVEITGTLSGLPGTTGATAGTLFVPVYGDINYVGFLCVDECNKASGSLNYTVNNLVIPCGCITGTFIDGSNKSYAIDLYNSATLSLQSAPISGSTLIDNIFCKSDFIITIPTLSPPLVELGLAFDNLTKIITLFGISPATTMITISCSTISISTITASAPLPYDLSYTICFKTCLPCEEQSCAPCPIKPQIKLPQPCWVNIFAGFDISVLVDNCNRLYVFGSIYTVRNNEELLERTCLEKLLNKANASISFPADQLNCAVNPVRGNCDCNKCKEKPFKTDLEKFGIHLNFPNEEECCSKNLSVCEFLQQLKRCNEAPTCGPICQPCDSYIYLNIKGNCACPCERSKPAEIGSVTLWNRTSVCKYVSQCECPDICCLQVDCESIVEFDFNTYCIDALNLPLDKVIKLNFCDTDGPNVDLFIDIDNPGGIKFNCCDKKCSVEFTVDECDRGIQCRECGQIERNCECNCDDNNFKHNDGDRYIKFALNFGNVLDPVVLTNFKKALGVNTYYPCPKFKNPFKSKLVNTYVKGGDHICFLEPFHSRCVNSTKLAITPDVPTVFMLKRRVLDVGVGNNSLSVLVGGLACPNEIYALGNNCYGELGLNSFQSTICWKKVDRCVFDCQVHSIFAGKNVTFYITQSYNVYASGQWKCLVNSATPVLLNSICKTWNIKEIAVSTNQLVLLGSDGCIFGLGDNSLGELGLCHLECVRKPTPLVFFYKMNNTVAEQLKEGLCHPIEARYYGKRRENSCDRISGDYDSYQKYDNDESKSKCFSCKYEVCQCKQIKYKYSNSRFANRRYVPNNRLSVSRCYR